MTKNEEVKGVIFIFVFSSLQPSRPKKGLQFIFFMLFEEGEFEKNIEKYHTQQRELQ